MQRFDVPLAQATTSSLEALKAYTFGMSKFAAGDLASAVPLFERAIELDPDFAMAYANLGRVYEVQGQGNPMYEALRKAFALRNRTSQRENFDISAVYYQFVTEQTDQAIEVCELWAQTYPSDFTPQRILGFENANLGRWEQSVAAFRKARNIDPTQALPYAGEMSGDLALNRMDDVRTVYQAAREHNLQTGVITSIRFLQAFLENDQATMTQLADELAHQRGFENKVLLEQSRIKLYFGQVRASRELSRVFFDVLTRKKDWTELATFEKASALEDALLGEMKAAREHATASLRLGGDPGMALALLGDSDQAGKIVEKMASQASEGGLADGILIPEIQASIALKRGNPRRAVELLEPVRRYESGWADQYFAAYLRGQAYLAARRAPEAALEFQKILDHPGIVTAAVIGSLSNLGLARANALQGNIQKARASYETFFNIWHAADKDVPVLIAARAEYAKLN